MNGQTDILGSLAMPLRLCVGALQSRSPSAWLISGGAADWLDEIGRWDVPLATVRLMVLPVGVLAMVEGDAKVTASPRAQPYVCLAGRLYLPAEARLHPPVSDNEIAELLGDDIAAFHPTLGFIRSSRSDLPNGLALCRIDPPKSEDWSFAVPGVYIEPRIRSVEPLEPPGMDMVMQSLRDDISTDTPDTLPPLPNEKTPRRLINGAKAGLFKMLLKGLPNPDSPSAAGDSLAKLSAWLASKAAALGTDLADARHRELARLMKLLERDPDAGLRFALPLTGENTGRGVAAPGSQLTRRDTNFSLSNVFGSSPTDTWETADEMRNRLTSRYRELANRELSLGRQRRAAYIFAELLGDFHSAANALMQGRFWREAAALYREKLKQFRTAAECLEKGGLLTEAITIYDELKDHEKVGDLFSLTRRPDDAAAAYRQAVNETLRVSDYVDGARLLEYKLNEPNEALLMLENGWPGSNQASTCLHAAFALMGQHGWHDRAQQRVRELKSLQNDEHAACSTAEVLAGVSRDYPVTAVRTLAADLTRVIAGSRLTAGAKSSETRRLLEAVQKAAIEDRLLVRDISRFQSQRPPDKPHAVAAPRPVFGPSAASPLKPPEIVKQFSLPKDVRWLQAAALKQSFVALGVSDSNVVVARVTYDGHVQLAPFRGPNSDSVPLALAANGDDIFVAPLLVSQSDRRYAARTMPAANGLPEARVGWPEYLPHHPLLGFALTDAAIWTATHDAPDGGGSALLRKYHRDGRLMQSREIVASQPSTRAFLAANDQFAWLLAGDMVHAAHTSSESDDPLQLRAPVISVGTSPPNTLFRLVVKQIEGVTIVWPRQRQTLAFARDLVNPAACLGHDGLLVAIGLNGGRAARLQGQEITAPISFQIDGDDPCEILTTPSRDTFALLYPTGRVAYLSFQRR